MKSLDKNSYYLIVQRINDKKYTNRIETPANLNEIKKLIDCMVGNISVYLYYENNSSKKYVTSFCTLLSSTMVSEFLKFSKLKIGRGNIFLLLRFVRFVF